MAKIHSQTLLDDMVRRQGLPLPLARDAAREILALVEDGLRRDGAVHLVNFGTFRLKPVAARSGFNPHTRQPITIAAHQRVTFSPAKALREHILTPAPPPLAPPAPGAVTPSPDRQAAGIEALAATAVAVLPDAHSAGEAAAAPVVAAPARQPDASAVAPPRTGTSSAAAVPASAPQTDCGTGGRRPLYLSAAALAALALLAVLLLRPTANVEEQPSEAAAPLPPTASTETHVAALAVTAAPVEEASVAAPAPAAPAPAPVPQAPPDTQAAPTFTPAPYFSERQYQVSRGDSLWRLAQRHYHDPWLWPHIYRANSDSLADPDLLYPHSTLIIPALEGAPDALTAGDRRHLAEGYHLVYRHYRNTGHPDAPHALEQARRYDPHIAAIGR